MKSKMLTKKRVSFLLAFVGGYLDAYTYLIRGHVFANAQTGNVVLLAIQVSQGNITGALIYIAPVISFILGVMLSEYLQMSQKKLRTKEWRYLTITLEILVLMIVGFLPLSVPNLVANCMISFVCSLQMHSFVSVKGLQYVSTICTGNLKSGSQAFMNYFVTKNKTFLLQGMVYAGILLFFILGAVLGGLFSNMLGVRSVWISTIPLMILLFMDVDYYKRSKKYSGANVYKL